MKLTPKEVEDKLGVKAVLIPIIAEAKKTYQKEWQKLTYVDTQVPSYQRKLHKARVIGVVLKTDITSLCSIDIDHLVLLRAAGMEISIRKVQGVGHEL